MTDRAPDRRPNVVIVVTDDQGYGDLRCLGNPYIETPNMDRLHAESVRLTDFHVDPTCSPSRSALMSGCYSHRVNVWHTVIGRNYMDPDRPTMPEIFRDGGYATGLFGKWHLGGHYPYRPFDRGFDRWLGHGDGGTGCMSDYWGNARVDDIYLQDGEEVRIPGFSADVFFDAAMSFIAEHAADPFFVYLPTYIPHDPNALPDKSWVDKYRDKVPLETGYFYSSIERADWNLGRLRKCLKELNIEDDTILVFMTDNGTAQGEDVFNADMRGKKGSVYEGGHRVPCFVRWPNGISRHGRDVSGLTGHFDVLPTLLELCSLDPPPESEFDGASFAGALLNPGSRMQERTLVVESQRIRHPQKYRAYSVMRPPWRLVNGDELYDLGADPGQSHNLAARFPNVVGELSASYERYWHDVSVGDERYMRPMVGAPGAENVRLSTEHMMPDDDGTIVWNQLQVEAGHAIWGFWPIDVRRAGEYLLECRRWPREVAAPMSGKAHYQRSGVSPSYLWDEEVTGTLYGAQIPAEPVALPVSSVRLRVDSVVYEEDVKGDTSCVRFRTPLSEGPASIRAEMLDPAGRSIGSAYYVYISFLA